MRVFHSVSGLVSITRSRGYHLSNRQAAIVGRRLRFVLQLTDLQYERVVSQLKGEIPEDVYGSWLSGREQESIDGFCAWYSGELAGGCAGVCYAVFNMNTGASVVFTSRGYDEGEEGSLSN